MPVRAGKLAALLAVLLLRRNEVVASDRLVEDLWNGEAPATASKTLQLYVSQLRRLLPADTLLTRAPGYVLRVEPGDVDADEFEALLASGREELEAGEPERAAATLRRALVLWRGPPLADFTYDEFARGEIERLEELRVEALEERIEADLARGRHAEVVGELESLRHEYPLRERLHVQLMLALYRCGRQADALVIYREARRRLDDELGIEPGPQLRELEGAILRQDASLAAPERPRALANPWRWSRRWKLAAAVAAAGAVAAVLAAALERGSSAGLASPNSLAVIDPGTGKVVAHVSVGAQAGLGQFVGTVSIDRRVAVGGGAVWVANRGDRTISRVDPKTRKVRTIVGIDDPIEDIAVAANGDPWTTLGAGGLDHVVHGSIDHVLPPDRGGPASSFSGLAAGTAALWIGRSDQGELSLVKYDPSAETNVGAVRIGTAGAHSIAVGGGFVWVSDSADSTVTRIDVTRVGGRPRRLKVADPGSVAVGGGKVWITSEIGNHLWYDDTRLEQPLDTTFVGPAPVSVAYGEGAVWVANHGDATVSKVDPNTQRVEKTIKVGRHVSSVAVGAGRVWVVVPRS